MGHNLALSHDGTKCLWFQESGPGFGCDASRISTSTFAPFAVDDVAKKAAGDARPGFRELYPSKEAHDARVDLIVTERFCLWTGPRDVPPVQPDAPPAVSD